MKLTPHPELLVQPEWLEAHLGDSKVKVIDCTVFMTFQPVGPSKVESGRPQWEEGHIPGAGYLHMVDDLSDPDGPFSYALPPPAHIAEKLRALGVNDGDTIVLYGAGYPAVVTRAWWVLRASGAPDVRLLDGGWERWVDEGRPVSSEAPKPARGRFTGRRMLRMVADRAEVRAAIDNPSVSLMNALQPEQFEGTGGAHYGRPGRIPRSISVPVRALFDPDTRRFHDIPKLTEIFARSGALEAERIIPYCGGGIAASGSCFALALVGHPEVALYDGSLLDWAADPALPMVTGKQD